MEKEDEIKRAAQWVLDTAQEKIKNPEGFRKYWEGVFRSDPKSLAVTVERMLKSQARKGYTVQREAEKREVERRRHALRWPHERGCQCRRDHFEPCRNYKPKGRSILEIWREASEETPGRIEALKAREYVTVADSYGDLSDRHTDDLCDLEEWQPGLVDKLERDAEAIVYEGMRRYLYVSNGKLAHWRTKNSIVKDRVFATFERLVNQALKDKLGG